MSCLVPNICSWVHRRVSLNHQCQQLPEAMKFDTVRRVPQYQKLIKQSLIHQHTKSLQQSIDCRPSPTNMCIYISSNSSIIQSLCIALIHFSFTVPGFFSRPCTITDSDTYLLSQGHNFIHRIATQKICMWCFYGRGNSYVLAALLEDMCFQQRHWLTAVFRPCEMCS